MSQVPSVTPSKTYESDSSFMNSNFCGQNFHGGNHVTLRSFHLQQDTYLVQVWNHKYEALFGMKGGQCIQTPYSASKYLSYRYSHQGLPRTLSTKRSKYRNMRYTTFWRPSRGYKVPWLTAQPTLHLPENLRLIAFVAGQKKLMTDCPGVVASGSINHLSETKTVRNPAIMNTEKKLIAGKPI